MSAMSDMSRAIRLEIEKHGGTTLRDLPQDVLAEYATIVAAFALDLRQELDRRERGEW